MRQSAQFTIDKSRQGIKPNLVYLWNEGNRNVFPKQCIQDILFNLFVI